MVKVTFVAANGAKTTVEGEDGASVMHTAVAHDVEGIVGECGGSMMCATCHCYVDDAWIEKTGERHDDEDDMLEGAASEVRSNSRLSCQIKLDRSLDGLVVHMPDEQF